jgi:hypothetical protein
VSNVKTEVLGLKQETAIPYFNIPNGPGYQISIGYPVAAIEISQVGSMKKKGRIRSHPVLVRVYLGGHRNKPGSGHARP